MIKRMLMILLILTLSGCRYLFKDYKAYDEESYQAFIDKMNEGQEEKISPAVYIDLRPLGDEANPEGHDYANGHISFFFNYDYRLLGKDKFLETVKSFYSPNHYVFLLDADGSVVSEAAQLMKDNGYRHLFFYTKGYDSLIGLAKEQLPTATGDCGC